jgi:hypothetical protein
MMLRRVCSASSLVRRMLAYCPFDRPRRGVVYSALPVYIHP